MGKQARSDTQALRVCKAESDPAFKEILSLEKKCFTKADSWRGDMGAELKKRNSFIVYVTNDEKSVVAYMLYTLNCLTAHIAKLAVCPKHRRQGWAAALLALVLQDLQTKRRIRTFTLHVADVNVPAKALYAKAGFVEDGFLEDYYAPGRHAYKMIKDCDDAR